MKKLLFMGALLLSASAFANEKCEKEKEIVEKEDVVAYCCTAYLWHGIYLVDQERYCGGFDPCTQAKLILLGRNKNTGLD